MKRAYITVNLDQLTNETAVLLYQGRNSKIYVRGVQVKRSYILECDRRLACQLGVKGMLWVPFSEVSGNFW